MAKKNGNGSADHDDGFIEKIESEVVDSESSPPAYQINIYPADFTTEMLVAKFKEEEIKIPGFQRNFVWKQKQSSRLIESFLLGLPVPPLYLYVDKTDKNRMLVVDGQQRLMSLVYYWSGHFGEPRNGKDTVFDLVGLNEKSPYKEKTFAQLEATDEAAHRKLRNAPLRCYIMKQLEPDDDTSIIHIYERLNTGGTKLAIQEIRNCIYDGSYNLMLDELNKDKEWRDIVGKQEEDERQRDIELILRFFALYFEADKYKKPMKDFLSRFMRKNKHLADPELNSHRELFIKTVRAVKATLGDKPFTLGRGINAALFDSVFTAFAGRDRILSTVKTKYHRLLKRTSFLELVTASTTDKDTVTKRLEVARKALFETTRR